MASTNDGRSETRPEARSAPPEATTEVKPGSRGVGAPPEQAMHPNQAVAVPPTPTPAHPPSHPLRRWLIRAGIVVGLAVAVYYLVPFVVIALTTISTDDAYVNSHVTFVAPRVPGQVMQVLVDDNYRVKKGALLVQLDKEPYQIQVNIKQAAVEAAERDLVAAKAQIRGLEAQARSQRWLMQTAMQNVASQIANLRAFVEVYKSKQATLALAQDNLKRGEELAPKGISKEELDQRKQTVKVDEAAVEQALQIIYSTRVGLDLPFRPPHGHELGEVPPDLDQTFSAVRTALANLVQTVAQLGLPLAGTDATPRLVLADFYWRDFRPPGAIGVGTIGVGAIPAPSAPLLGVSLYLGGKGDIDRILDSLVPDSPAVLQAQAKLLQTRRDLDQALLNLRYCDVVSEIDGVVTRRNVNPGNNVQAGQSLMAIRSLTEVWVDANFKETQLASLRIGQRVRCEVDMYGSRREYEGRITGFTMGTGETLALLPPQNATGNFVKIVQRLPVRVEFPDYNPDKDPPLFVGLSVTPYVYYREPLKGPHAGDVLQPIRDLPQLPIDPKP
jgi:membrane fusion protein, multidrug efflux system